MTHRPHPEPVAQPAIETRTGSWSADKQRIVAAGAALIGAGILTWGVWATNKINDICTIDAVQSQRLEEIDRSSRERDKQVAEIAAQAAQSIQAQLAQIQTTLAEIQRELRKK